MKQKVYEIRYQGNRYHLCIKTTDNARNIAYKLLGLDSALSFLNNYNVLIKPTNINPNGFKLNNLEEVFSC